MWFGVNINVLLVSGTANGFILKHFDFLFIFIIIDENKDGTSGRREMSVDCVACR